MKQQRTALTLVLALAGFLFLSPSLLSAQGGPPTPPGQPSYLAIGISAGGGGVDNKRLFDSWDFGPVFGARVEWSRGPSSWLLYVDAQPFRAGRSNQPGDFKALYIMPAYLAGSEGLRVGLALGAGIFDLTSETGDDGREVAFVPSLFGSGRLTRTLSLEFGWKRVRNVRELRADVFTIQLVQRFRF
jgi:hypothetical protein